MSFKINPDGSITTDDMDEALAMQARIAERLQRANTEQTVTPTTSNGNGDSAADGWARFLVRLKPNQRRLLEVVKARKKLTMDDAVAAMGDGAPAGKFSISGLLTGISRNATGAGLGPKKVLKSSSQGWGDKKVVYLLAGPLLEANDT